MGSFEKKSHNQRLKLLAMVLLLLAIGLVAWMYFNKGIGDSWSRELPDSGVVGSTVKQVSPPKTAEQLISYESIVPLPPTIDSLALEERAVVAMRSANHDRLFLARRDLAALKKKTPEAVLEALKENLFVLYQDALLTMMLDKNNNQAQRSSAEYELVNADTANQNWSSVEVLPGHLLTTEYVSFLKNLDKAYQQTAENMTRQQLVESFSNLALVKNYLKKRKNISEAFYISQIKDFFLSNAEANVKKQYGERLRESGDGSLSAVYDEYVAKFEVNKL